MKIVALKMLMIGASFLFTNSKIFAQQSDQAVQAHAYADSGNYNKAIDIYSKLYEQSPNDVYSDYLDVLLKAKEYKEAEKLVYDHLNAQQKKIVNSHASGTNPLSTIDLGRVYEAKGKDKKAEEQYEAAIQMLNGDDMLTQQVAHAFTNIGKPQYTMRTYERAISITGNNYLYSTSLAKLYAQNGDIDKAVGMLLDRGPGQYVNLENSKTLLLEILGNDQKKLQLAQKTLFKKINENPEDPYYAELLTWLYVQKNDWDGALIQIEAIDARNKEDGHRLLEFANVAERAKQYDIAIKADDEVMDKGQEQPFYPMAQSQKLRVEFQQLKNNISYTQQGADSLAKQYESFFTAFPKGSFSSEAILDYAMLEAQYANDPQKGVDILEKVLAHPDISRDLTGRIKLQLGDYYILTGRVWDASLTYSQVDKEFKEDAMGEEARFRNAKLAYYRGDFTWAQKQLSVLKASTSELIANDALYLSVLITENVPDSNYYPLQRFAYADLLLFQNKDKEAETLLDSISAAFPQHSLNDDILMLRAKIAEKHRDYPKALAYLKQVYEQYGKDVLGDDAVIKTAEIYETYLKQNDQAKHFYEQLILDYPGSTYVQTARQRLQQLNNPAVQ